jgi:hypothetical protein
MKRYSLFAACVLVALTSASCDEKLSSITGPTPDLAPSLSAIQRTIFSASDSSNRLACVGCHSDQGRTPAANLNLVEGRSHAQLVGRASGARPGATLVIPGDPDNSYLVKKLEGAADITGLRMPRNNGPFLTEGQMLVIRKWIQDGAANN